MSASGVLFVSMRVEDEGGSEDRWVRVDHITSFWRETYQDGEVRKYRLKVRLINGDEGTLVDGVTSSAYINQSIQQTFGSMVADVTRF